jgi:hypothetical protein
MKQLRVVLCAVIFMAAARAGAQDAALPEKGFRRVGMVTGTYGW